MATDLNGEAPPTVPIPIQPPRTYRPTHPDRSPGRWLRMCAGIREDILDWTPSERARYTGLGVIVLNTGCLAAFAMLTALGTITAAPAAALVPFALVWGWIIFSVDRWLITSTHGVRGANRALILLPRLMLAILLAFTIAEPLTLRIFQNTLDTQVRTSRTTQLSKYESDLQTCNPASGQWNGSATCAHHHLAVVDSPYPVQQKLAADRQEQSRLQAIVSADQKEDQKKTSIAQGECAGTAGADMSGSTGNGPRCQADWNAEKAFVRDSGMTAKQNQLTTLATVIFGLVQQAGSARAQYATQLHTAITRAVAAKQADLGQIGILDEWTALEELSASSTFVFFGHWLLVLILLALDCLPVLAKLMSGSTVYDRLLADQVTSDEHIYEINLRLRQDTATVDKEVEIYLLKLSKRDRMRALDQADRVRKAKGDTDGLDDVRALAAQWLQEATGQR